MVILPTVIAFDYERACEILAGRGFKVAVRLTRPPGSVEAGVPFGQVHPGNGRFRVVRERQVGPGEVELILAGE